MTYDHIEQGTPVQTAVREALEQGVDIAKLMELSDFYVMDDGQNPYDLIQPILRAGHKMEFNSHQCHEAYDSNSEITYYFVGREEELVAQIHGLLDD